MEEAEEKARQIRGTILKLEPDASAAYVQWELSLLFEKGNSSVQ